MSVHGQGPLSVTVDKNGAILIFDAHYVVARVGTRIMTQEKRKAMERLALVFAAAPELLEALESALWQLDAGTWDRDVALAAIKKAKGGDA